MDDVPTDFSPSFIQAQKRGIKSIMVNELNSSSSDEEFIKNVVSRLENEVFFDVMEYAQNQIKKVRYRLILVMKERDMLQKEMDGVKMVLNSLHVEVTVEGEENGNANRIKRK